MENTLELSLKEIGEQFTVEVETRIGNPVGTCYLMGHCLAEGFKRAGFEAREVSGTAIYKDKFEKNVIYGKQILKGNLIGYYHTWCSLEIDGREITIDPSYKYNKTAMRDYYGVKLNKAIPDVIVSDKKSTWLYQFVEDCKLTNQSKICLKRLPSELIDELIECAFKLITERFNAVKTLVA